MAAGNGSKVGLAVDQPNPSSRSSRSDDMAKETTIAAFGHGDEIRTRIVSFATVAICWLRMSDS